MTRYFLDTETTSLLQRHRDPYTLDAEPRIVSIAVVRGDGSVVGAQRLNPGVPIPEAASRVHGIRDEDVAHSPTFAQVWPRLLAKVGDAALVVAHNAPYDAAVLACELLRAGLPLPRWRWLDTLAAARRVIDAREPVRAFRLRPMGVHLPGLSRRGQPLRRHRRALREMP